MEVADSPLNLAHQQCRKAERLVAAGKYEEAISCHGTAADLLKDAMKLTDCEQARLSMELQRDSHVKQQRVIQERWKRETRREAARPGPPRPSPDPRPPALPQASPRPPSPPPGPGEREYDTLLYQLQTRCSSGPSQAPCLGSKTTKDDKTRLEEQQTTLDGLRRLLEQLMDQNLRLATQNQQLRTENARLRSEAADVADLVERSELWVLPQAGGGREKKGKEIAIPQLPPLEMPAQEDLCLELPEDIQNELQELLDRDKP